MPITNDQQRLKN